MYPLNGFLGHTALELLEEIPNLGLALTWQLPGQLDGVPLLLALPCLQ